MTALWFVHSQVKYLKYPLPMWCRQPSDPLARLSATWSLSCLQAQAWTLRALGQGLAAFCTGVSLLAAWGCDLSYYPL